MTKRLTMIFLLALSARLHAEAPWVGADAESCIEQWRKEAVIAMNNYVGDAAFNKRKPWRIDRFGRLRAASDTSNNTPDDYDRYDDPYSFMWDYYGHTLRDANGRWLLPEMQAAGVPSLRKYVRDCRTRTSGRTLPMEKTFFEPELSGHRIASCLYWSSGCGEPAAQHFCREKGYARATLWEIEFNIADRKNPTYVMGDDRFCKLDSCDGFKFIACSSLPQSDSSTARVESGFARYGADYRVFTPSPVSAEACASACSEESRCKAWTFDQQDGKCRLKHSVNPLTPAPGCTSGVRS